ncbi:MAG: 6-pyruvoyl-tetrahydropterin synthase-related protein [Anaerolineae bacterium]
MSLGSIPRNRSHWLTLLALLLLGLFAAHPLLIDPRLPEAHDVRFHLYRLVQLDEMIREGVFYSRWAPDMAYGYGYPIFNYYAPAAYYVAELFCLLGFSYTVALRLTFALALVVTALATYAWLRDLLDPEAALVAAAAYTAAPYMMILLLYRGALAELFALALLPAVLWATHRFLVHGRTVHGVLGTGLYALLILTHNITAMLATAVLVGYGLSLVLTLWLRNLESARKQAGLVLRRSLFILGLGLGLSCFFWLPALAERDLVHIYQLYLPTALRFDTNFVALPVIFGLPVPADPRLVYQTRPMSRLHLGVVGLAVLALPGIWRLRRRLVQRTVLFLALTGAVSAMLMSLPLSSPLWEHLPLLPFIQFPWRFLGVGSFFLAILAGAALYVWRDLLPDRVVARALMPLLVLVLTLYVTPWQYMRRYPPMGALTMLESARFERQTGSLGTTTMGEFLPVTVRALPEEDSPALVSGERLDVTSLPAGAEVLHAAYGPTRYELLLQSPERFTAVFHTFDFPGWRAEIDGEPASITPTDPHGLIGVEVPAGRHHLVVHFGTTPVRAWATAISAVAALSLLGATLVLRKRHGPPIDRITQSMGVRPDAALSVLSVVLLVLTLKLAYIDREGQQTLFRRTRFDGQGVEGVDYPMTVNFAHRLHLLGVDAPTSATSGSELEITLYWRVPVPVEEEYSVGLALVDARGVRYAQSDHQHPGGYPPTTRWSPEAYAEDPHELQIMPGTPPSTYTLQASVYPYGEPEQALDVLNADGAPIGRTATLVPLTVTRPKKPPTREALAPETSTDAPVTNGLRLIGYDVPSTSLWAGELLPLTLYWEATETPTDDLDVEVALRDARGETVPLATVPPVPGYPTSQWRAGDRWRGVHRLLLPPTLEGGDYQILVRGAGHAAPLVLGTVKVQAPEHVMEPPEVEHAQTALFGDVARLLGYDAPRAATLRPGESFSLTLVWQARRQTRTAYKTFVHLLDGEGRRVAGSDQVPGSWQRPTTGWIAGEYIVDAHTLHVPPELPEGVYRLQTGLYEARSGERLLRPDGADAAVLDIALEVRP